MVNEELKKMLGTNNPDLSDQKLTGDVFGAMSAMFDQMAKYAEQMSPEAFTECAQNLAKALAPLDSTIMQRAWDILEVAYLDDTRE